jgi:Tfp pilus assembly protein PilO
MTALKNQSGRYSTLQWAMAGLSFAMAVGFYFGLIRPADNRRVASRANIDWQLGKLADNQREATRLPAVREEVRALKTRLVGLDKKLPKRPDTDQFVREITQVSEQCSLKKVNMQVGSPRRNDVVSEMPISLNFNGDFQSVMAFLRSSEDLQRLTRVRSLNIKNREPLKGNVEVDVAMNVYFDGD